MEMCMDDKRKLSKKDSRRPATVAPAATGLKGRASRSPAWSMPGRLVSLAKEQRARFFIMRRCITMLVRWRD